ncbi:MAG: hypothetical protein V9G19_02895 [Tetrasphaera sp.]
MDGFVAATAVGGGAALAAGLEDDHLGLDLLSGTAFTSYLWPGVALARLSEPTPTERLYLAAAAAMAGLGLFAVRRHGPVRSGPRNSRS